MTAPTQLVVPDRDGEVWHGFVPGVGAVRVYGFRVNGPFDPAHGLRYNAAKLLLDPYARVIVGEARYGPEVLGHAVENPCAPSKLDSAAHVPRSVVLADMAPAVSRPRRGRPITTDRLDVKLALLLCHWYGNAVLQPSLA